MSTPTSSDASGRTSGTRALLLTDVVDSTKLSEQLGDAGMAALWAKHDRVARDLLRVHRGREIDKTDGFLLLFEVASDAVAYAVAYHRAIAPLDLKARAAVHVGPLILTENAPADVARGAKPLEVDGLAKPIAARIMGAAVAGQTLLSEDARAALGATPYRVMTHGHWRMKGLSEPLELFEVGEPDAPFSPPPDSAKVYRVVRRGELWLPVAEVPRHLPAERDVFVGRNADLVELAHRIDEGARLVSVLGMGGTGKTRLVTRYAWTWLGDWPGGVWFCDLSEARSVDGILSAVARALGIKLDDHGPVTQLGHAIAGRGRCLFVLDNFEQVVRFASETLGRWLDRASDARFVVTTREVLGLPGESAFALSPLTHDDAQALFLERARSADRDFQPAHDDAIGALVELLDRLPLAIELAAARVRTMSPRTMLSRMSERFKLLTSGGGRRDRHATLRATLDWSWGLLAQEEQAGLAQLSVFEGGFLLSDAEVVLSVEPSWPTDVLQALVDRSLVRRVGDERFDLLVSVQEYAAERLAERGERTAAEARHGACFAARGTQEAQAALRGAAGATRMAALQQELDNLVVAVRRAAGRGAPDQALDALSAVYWVLRCDGSVPLGRSLAALVLAMPELPSQLRARAEALAGSFALLAGHAGDAEALLESARAVFSLTGDRLREAGASNDLSSVCLQQGRTEVALEHAEKAYAIYVAVGVRQQQLATLGQATTLGVLGQACRRLGRVDEARAHYDAALALNRAAGDQAGQAAMLSNLGLLHKEQGRLDEAVSYNEAALVLHRTTRDGFMEAALRVNMAGILELRGRVAEARALLETSLSVFRALGRRSFEGLVLGNLGKLDVTEGRLEAAATQLEAALAIHREVGNRTLEGSVLHALGFLSSLGPRPAEAEAHLRAALTLCREAGDRRQEGKVLRDLARSAVAGGRRVEARDLLDEAERSLRAVGDVLELGYSHCVRVMLEVGWDAGAAEAALAEAARCAEQLGVDPSSAFARELSEAQLAVARGVPVPAP